MEMESEQYNALIEKAKKRRQQSKEDEKKKKKEEAEKQNEEREKKNAGLSNELKQILVKGKETVTKELEQTSTAAKEEKVHGSKEKGKKGNTNKRDKKGDNGKKKKGDNGKNKKGDDGKGKNVTDDSTFDSMKGCTSGINMSCDKVVDLSHYLEGEEITHAHLIRFVEDEIQICYDSFDVNGDEDLSVCEMICAFHFFGLDDVKADDVNAVIKEFADTSKDKLSYPEFRSEMYNVICDGTTDEHVKMVFDLIDTDKTGLIGRRQVLRLFSKLGILLTQAELEEALQEIGLPADGMFDYARFKAFCFATDPMLQLKERMDKQKNESEE